MYRSIIKSWPLFIPLIFFLLIQFRLGLSHLNLSDEGFLLENARLIATGHIPYKDFFLTTTPGIYYLHALVIKLFGSYVFLTRLLYLGIITLILYSTFRLSRLKSLPTFIILTGSALVSLGFRQFAFYNETALALALLTFFTFTRHPQLGAYTAFLTGIFTAFTFFTKQSIGLLVLAAVTVALILKVRSLVKIVRPYLWILAGFSLPLLSYALYLAYQGALIPALYHIFLYASEVKHHQQAYILHRLVFLLMAVSFTRFVRQYQVLTRPVVLLLLIGFSSYLLISPQHLGRLITYTPYAEFYYDTFIFGYATLILCWTTYRHQTSTQYLRTISVFLLAIFLGSAASGLSLLTTILSTPLLLLAISHHLKYLQHSYHWSNGYSYLLLALLTATFIARLTTHKFLYLTPLLYPHHQSQIPALQHISLYPWHQAELELIRSIQQELHPRYLICFPYCPMLNFINQLDSPSYFHFFYHETFLPSQQDQVINDLTTHPDTLIVIQQPGIIEPHAKDQHLRFPKLMKALETLGNPVASTPGFLIRFY